MPGDRVSCSPFEAFTLGDERFVVKHLGREYDWIMRALGDWPSSAR